MKNKVLLLVVVITGSCSFLVPVLRNPLESLRVNFFAERNPCDFHTSVEVVWLGDLIR